MLERTRTVLEEEDNREPSGPASSARRPIVCSKTTVPHAAIDERYGSRDDGGDD